MPFVREPINASFIAFLHSRYLHSIEYDVASKEHGLPLIATRTRSEGLGMNLSSNYLGLCKLLRDLVCIGWREHTRSEECAVRLGKEEFIDGNFVA